MIETKLTFRSNITVIRMRVRVSLSGILWSENMQRELEWINQLTSF